MGLAVPQQLPVAFIACSLVAEQRTSATELRYSRSQRNYSFLDAYEDDEMMTYRKVVSAVDWLIAHGYAEGRKGVWWLSKQSIMWATPKLMDIVGHLVDLTARQGAMLRDEIVLRDKDGNSIGFTDTGEIRRMRQELKAINAHLAAQQYLLNGSALYISPATRIFNQTFRRGGRLYHQGSSYQQMPKDKRAQIKMLVDGELCDTVELDFESLHMRLVYARAGKTMPAGDLYEVEGFSRKLAKVATLISLNADGTEIGAITGVLSSDEELCAANDLDHRSPSMLRAAAERLVAAIKRKHYRVKEFFGTGAGAELMKADSDIAVRIMRAMIEQAGRCPLVVHDSFIVPAMDAPLLEDLMTKALASHTLSSTRPVTSSTTSSQRFYSRPPIHLGKHHSEQGLYVLPQTYAREVFAHTRELAQLHGPDP